MADFEIAFGPWMDEPVLYCMSLHAVILPNHQRDAPQLHYLRVRSFTHSFTVAN